MNSFFGEFVRILSFIRPWAQPCGHKGLPSMNHIFFAIILYLFSPAIEAEERAMLIGVARSDGVIIPFACFDGSRWDNPWPEAGATADTSIHALDAIPKAWYDPLAAIPREWFIRTISESFRAVEVKRAVSAQSRRSSITGLESGFISKNTVRSWEPQPGSPSIPQTNRGISKEGIALSRNSQTYAIAAVEKESAEWRAMFAVIREEFSKAEEKRGHPLQKEVREGEELVMLSLYKGVREPDGSTVCRFEAARNYVASALLPGSSPAGCSRLSGWIRLDRTGRPSLIQKEFVLERFSAPLEQALFPLGMLAIGGINFWVVEERLHGDEYYKILEINRSGVRTVVRAYGGGS